MLFYAVLRLLVVLLLIGPQLACTTVTNRTIDDQYGDSVTGRLPKYENSWNYGPGCPGCLAQPSKNNTFRTSWHDTTTSRPSSVPAHTVSLLFNGTAVWVYCIVPNHIANTNTYVNISFNLDGETVGNYTHEPDPKSDDYMYNVTVYSNAHLTNTQHLLVITAVQESQASLLLFDWAEYTYDDAIEATMTTVVSTSEPTETRTTSHSASYTSISGGIASSNNTSVSSSGTLQDDKEASRFRSALIGSLIGGGGASAILLLTITFICRRRRWQNTLQRAAGDARPRQRASWAPVVEPYIKQAPLDRPLSPPAYMHTTTHRRVPSASVPLHSAAIEQPAAVSISAPATVGVSEADARDEESAQERAARQTRKLREMVEGLRR